MVLPHDAQVLRPSESLYAQFRGGVSAYFGDLDDSEGFENPGVGAGVEVGYLFNPNVSFGLGFMYHDLPIRGLLHIDLHPGRSRLECLLDRSHRVFRRMQGGDAGGIGS